MLHTEQHSWRLDKDFICQEFWGEVTRIIKRFESSLALDSGSMFHCLRRYCNRHFSIDQGLLSRVLRMRLNSMHFFPCKMFVVNDEDVWLQLAILANHWHLHINIASVVDLKKFQGCIDILCSPQFFLSVKWKRNLQTENRNRGMLYFYAAKSRVRNCRQYRPFSFCFSSSCIFESD